ncbi:hypothetical protein DAHU10_014570 [Hanseniaspora uvarum]|nr:hypothetical protein DAHU10_014570 [Hanseniaspora uvarum]
MVLKKINFIIACLSAVKQLYAYGHNYNQTSNENSYLTTIDGTVYSMPSALFNSKTDLNITIATTNAVTTSNIKSSETVSDNVKSVISSTYKPFLSGQVTTTIPEIIDKTITVDTSKILTITSCKNNACETKKYYTLETSGSTNSIVSTYVLTTSYTTVEDTITYYTTWCPLTASQATSTNSSFKTSNITTSSFETSIYPSVATPVATTKSLSNSSTSNTNKKTNISTKTVISTTTPKISLQSNLSIASNTNEAKLGSSTAILPSVSSKVFSASVKSFYNASGSSVETISSVTSQSSYTISSFTSEDTSSVVVKSSPIISITSSSTSSNLSLTVPSATTETLVQSSFVSSSHGSISTTNVDLYPVSSIQISSAAVALSESSLTGTKNPHITNSEEYPTVLKSTLFIDSTKIYTVTSCSNNDCKTHQYYTVNYSTDSSITKASTYVLSTSVVTQENVVTEYTTWCPLTATESKTLTTFTEKNSVIFSSSSTPAVLASPLITKSSSIYPIATTTSKQSTCIATTTIKPSKYAVTSSDIKTSPTSSTLMPLSFKVSSKPDALTVSSETMPTTTIHTVITSFVTSGTGTKVVYKTTSTPVQYSVLTVTNEGVVTQYTTYCPLTATKKSSTVVVLTSSTDVLQSSLHIESSVKPSTSILSSVKSSTSIESSFKPINSILSSVKPTTSIESSVKLTTSILSSVKTSFANAVVFESLSKSDVESTKTSTLGTIITLVVSNDSPSTKAATFVVSPTKSDIESKIMSSYTTIEYVSSVVSTVTTSSSEIVPTKLTSVPINSQSSTLASSSITSSSITSTIISEYIGNADFLVANNSASLLACILGLLMI